MINRDDIEVGDKCYTRDGGCLVARKEDAELMLGWHSLEEWLGDGTIYSSREHPLDIIRIEKAPKPVVEEIVVLFDKEGLRTFGQCPMPAETKWDHAIKLTIINGKLEKSEQVK